MEEAGRTDGGRGGGGGGRTLKFASGGEFNKKTAACRLGLVLYF